MERAVRLIGFLDFSAVGLAAGEFPPGRLPGAGAGPAPSHLFPAKPPAGGTAPSVLSGAFAGKTPAPGASLNQMRRCSHGEPSSRFLTCISGESAATLPT